MALCQSLICRAAQSTRVQLWFYSAVGSCWLIDLDHHPPCGFGCRTLSPLVFIGVQLPPDWSSAARFWFPLLGGLWCLEVTGFGLPVLGYAPRVSVWCVLNHPSPQRTSSWCGGVRLHSTISTPQHQTCAGTDFSLRGGWADELEYGKGLAREDHSLVSK